MNNFYQSKSIVYMIQATLIFKLLLVASIFFSTYALSQENTEGTDVTIIYRYDAPTNEELITNSSNETPQTPEIVDPWNGEFYSDGSWGEGSALGNSVSHTELGYKYWRITGPQLTAQQGTEIEFTGLNNDQYVTPTDVGYVPFRLSFGPPAFGSTPSSELISGVEHLFDGDRRNAQALLQPSFGNQFVFEFDTPITPWRIEVFGQGVDARNDSILQENIASIIEYSSDGIVWNVVTKNTNHIWNSSRNLYNNYNTFNISY